MTKTTIMNNIINEVKRLIKEYNIDRVGQPVVSIIINEATMGLVVDKIKDNYELNGGMVVIYLSRDEREIWFEEEAELVEEELSNYETITDGLLVGID